MQGPLIGGVENTGGETLLSASRKRSIGIDFCGEDIEGESRETLSAREKEVLGMNVGIHIDAFKYPRWH